MSNGYGSSATSPISRDESIQLIVQACLDAGINNEKQIAYVLATAEHESQNFTALEENFGRKQAVDRGYQGGEDYFGRGYAHLTHDYNYRAMGQRLGIAELEQQPQLAAQPEHAANILAVGMREGIYTGRRLDRYINDEATDYVQARRVVNGIDKADHIAGLARDWEGQVPGLVSAIQRDGVNLGATTPAAASSVLRQGMADENVFHMQQYLVALGATANNGRGISADGDFGQRTHQAVVRYQQQAQIEPANGQVSPAMLEQMRSQVLQADPGFELKTFTELHGPQRSASLSPHTSDYQTLFPQVLQQLHLAERERGVAAGPHSDNLAGVITVASLREGVQPHRVELNADGSMARAVQLGAGGDDPLFNRSTSAIATAQAVSVPEAHSADTAQRLANATPALDAGHVHSQQTPQRPAMQMG